MDKTNFPGGVKSDGGFEGNLLGLLVSKTFTKADSYTLTDADKVPVVCITMSAASKALTLGLKDGEAMLVYNAGATNAVTVKNLSGDTGTSVAAGKVALVVASTTADATKVLVLN